MSNAIDNVRQGRRTYTASGALSDGMLVVPHSTAGQVVASPTTGPVSMVCLTNAANAEDVEVIQIVRGSEYRFLASNTVTAGSEVEIDSAGNIGKIKNYSAGTKIGRAQESGAAGGLVRVIAY